MYCPDTLERLNSREVEKYLAAVQEPAETKDRLEEIGEALETGSPPREPLKEKAALEKERDEIQEILMKALPSCDYCDNPATHVIPVYNPADGVRDIAGAYSVLHVCEECYEDGTYMEENFYCPDCGELFIMNHSWDIVAVIDSESGEVYCQKCYAENHLEPQPLSEVLDNLGTSHTGGWKRLNSVPGKELLWEGEFSGYSDFPGHTSLDTVRQEILEAAEEAGLEEDAEVYPVIPHGYQFSIVLAVYR